MIWRKIQKVKEAQQRIIMMVMLQIYLADHDAGLIDAAKHNWAGMSDLINLGTEPDIKEFCDPDTWNQIWEIAKEMIPGLRHKRAY